jgi:vesicle coat complex subunit
LLIVNLTTETLSNLNVEFATMGDPKVVEKPQPQNLGPNGFVSVKAHIKVPACFAMAAERWKGRVQPSHVQVTSTDAALIFGNIVYDGAGNTGMSVISMNEIPIDIMAYIQPATCDETKVREGSTWVSCAGAALCIPLDVRPSSVPCGASLNGRTKSTPRPTSRKHLPPTTMATHPMH